jgi:hypothetical protein
VHAHPLSLHLPSPVKLQCTLQLSGQKHLPCFISRKICTLWVRQPYAGVNFIPPLGSGQRWRHEGGGCDRTEKRLKEGKALKDTKEEAVERLRGQGKVGAKSGEK